MADGDGPTATSIDSPAELWRSVVEKAGLDLARYDEPVVVELAEALNLPIDGFGEALADSQVTTEALLQELLLVIAPYGSMVRDVLAFFAAVSARATDENLRIRFDFAGAGENFDFDLENFREFERRTRRVLEWVQLYEIDGLQAKELRHAFVVAGVTYEIRGGAWTDLPAEDAAVARWIDETSAGTRALHPLPPPPVAAPGLAEQLARVWLVVAAAATDDASPLLSPDDVRTVVRGAYALAQEPGLLTRRLAEFFARLPSRPTQVEAVVEDLFEIFNMPVWKRRSELYSVWVGTTIMSAFAGPTNVHVVDDALVFAFGGSHLATVETPGGHLHVWCELRTPLADPLSGKRKGHIQPDYVISREPLLHPSSGALVVECKQYLKQSRRNFSEALVDYARGHPGAEVVLVNYGPITESVLEKVAEVAPLERPRTHVVAKLRPGEAEALSRFERLVGGVEQADSAWLANDAAADQAAAVRVSAGGSLSLFWSAADDDLDLHCWCSDPRSGAAEHVYYQDTSRAWRDFAVRLDVDQLAGGAAETVSWTGLDGVVLRFAVHAYSGATNLRRSGATVELRADGLVLEVRPPPDSCEWWRLLEYRTGSREVVVHGDCQFPNEEWREGRGG